MLLPTLRAQNISLEDLIAALKQPVETQELRFKINDSDYRATGEKVIASLAHHLPIGVAD